MQEAAEMADVLHLAEQGGAAQCGVQVTAEQAEVIVRSLKSVRDGAAKASLLLALKGLGNTDLWRRADALEREMLELLAGLKPTLTWGSQMNENIKTQEDAMEPSTWTIDVNSDGVRFIRMHDGSPCEVYPRVPHSKAAIYAAAITQGIQPPRDLRPCGGPFD